MRYNEIVEASPNDTLISGTFYHGCPVEAKAEQIIQHGIQPQDASLKNQRPNGYMTPVKGRVYLTPQLQYAICYALGGDYAGHQPSDSMLKYGGQYGYLFVIPGSELSDIQPDEDSIGDFFYKNTKYTRGSNAITYNGVNDNEIKTIWTFIFKNLTEKQRIKICQGEYAFYAQGGKRVVKNMPDWMKLKLIELGSHIANEGGIIPSQVWKIDKRKSYDLKEDGSNFFDIAERIK